MSGAAIVRTTHQGKLFTVEIVEHRGRDGKAREREVVRHPGAVVIVPVLDRDRLVMVRNYRVAVDDRLLELPAGKLESGEDPTAAASRELEEETGYRAGRVLKMGEFFTSPGFADELMRAFVAEDLTFQGQRLEGGEDIEVVIVYRDEAIELATCGGGGGLRDGKSIAALLMWDYQLRRGPA